MEDGGGGGGGGWPHTNQDATLLSTCLWMVFQVRGWSNDVSSRSSCSWSKRWRHSGGKVCNKRGGRHWTTWESNLGPGIRRKIPFTIHRFDPTISSTRGKPWNSFMVKARQFMIHSINTPFTIGLDDRHGFLGIPWDPQKRAASFRWVIHSRIPSGK